MRSSITLTVCAFIGSSLLLSGCVSDVNRARKKPQAPDRESLIYNGATVEERVGNALQPRSPAPLETEEERQARIAGHTLAASPCDLHIQSIPHGIAISFLTKPGSDVEVGEIREQVELLARMHNKLFQVPEATVENGPAVPVRLDPTRADHAPLRALMAIPSRASWEETPGGARLVLSADSEEDLADLRAHVRWHAPQLLPNVMSARKRCPQVPDLQARLHDE